MGSKWKYEILVHTTTYCAKVRYGCLYGSAKMFSRGHVLNVRSHVTMALFGSLARVVLVRNHEEFNNVFYRVIRG